eukprot:COSAG01_NODE_17938_length_1113_cov_0.907298_1_plen_301_part_10
MGVLRLQLQLLLLPAVAASVAAGGSGTLLSVWPRPTLLEGDPSSSQEQELAGPVTFRLSCAGGDRGRFPANLESYYRRVLFRHGAPVPGKSGVAPLTISLAVADCTAKLGLRANESYALSLDGGAAGISIQAPTQLGAMHALETLAQLIHWQPGMADGDGGYTVVAGDGLRVVDAPFFPHRELMVDCARFFLPIALLEQVIDAMAATKLNVLHLHASDSESMPIVFKSRPEFAQIAFSPRERYTLRQLAALAGYAAGRGVRLLVEIDIPSHTGTLAEEGAPGWCRPFPEVCPRPRCEHNVL